MVFKGGADTPRRQYKVPDSINADTHTYCPSKKRQSLLIYMLSIETSISLNSLREFNEFKETKEFSTNP